MFELQMLFPKQTSYLFEKLKFPGIRCIASHNMEEAKVTKKKVAKMNKVVGITPANKDKFIVQ